ncbi:MAG: hypothetical protein AB7O87_07690 [Candidatus Nitrosocosmicus sp.]
MIVTSQSEVALSFETPLITNDLLEFKGTRSPLSGEVIFIPPSNFVVVVAGSILTLSGDVGDAVLDVLLTAVIFDGFAGVVIF